MALDVKVEMHEEIRVLGLKGRLDTDTSADLELAVQDLIDAGAEHFVIDLTGVGYVSSAGLRVLLMLAKKVDGSGSLRLCGLNPTVRQVFDVAGFTQLFQIFPDRDSLLQPGGAEPKSTPVAKEGNPLAATVAKLLGVKARQSASGKISEQTIADVMRVLGSVSTR